MLMPSIFGDNLLDDFWGMPSLNQNFQGMGSTSQNLMNTDVRETEQGYEISINLPGFKKESVKGEIKDGYLTIHASTSNSNDTKDKDGKYIRRERFSGSCSRSFYVGDQVTEADIKAKFEDGVLKIDVPKMEAKPAVEEKHYISIEG